MAIRQVIRRFLARILGPMLGCLADMLEERARAVLNFAHPDEIVVIAPRKPKG
jgi:cell division protein FtsB